MPQPVEALWYVGRLPGRAATARLAIVGARAASMPGCRAGARAGGVGGAQRDSRSSRAARSGSTRPRTAARSTPAARRSPCSAAASTSSIPIATPRCSRTSPRRAACISEYAPGTPPRRGQFPARNRIIAALAEAVLVVEAGLASGALITGAPRGEAGAAACSPFPAARAPDELIATRRRAAGRRRGGAARRAGGRGAARSVRFRRASRRWWPRCAAGDAAPAELARRLGLPLADTLALIAEAELDGWICRRPGGALASMENARGN